MLFLRERIENKLVQVNDIHYLLIIFFPTLESIFGWKDPKRNASFIELGRENSC